MLKTSGSCDEFRETLHRYLDCDLELVGQAVFVGHSAVCDGCREALLQYNSHIHAHRILEAGGHLDEVSISSIRSGVASGFRLISERVVRKQAKELGQLKFQILEAQLKNTFGGHAWPPEAGALNVPRVVAETEARVSSLERFKESSVIFAAGGMVDLKTLRQMVEEPAGNHGPEGTLNEIAGGLLAARTLDPSLDEYVLQHLGHILERLGHYSDAVTLFLNLASLPPHRRLHLRARALNSAARTCLRHLDRFDASKSYLAEADALFPDRWSIEYNLASWYLWPTNPNRNQAEGERYFLRASSNLARTGHLSTVLAQDPEMQKVVQEAGIQIPPGEEVPLGASESQPL